MKKQILTTYGLVELEVRPIEGSEVYVAGERHVFPAGTKTRQGETLEKAFVLPQGAVLVPYWDDFEGRAPARLHRVFPAGIYEALRSTLHAVFGYGLGGKRGELQILRDISDRLSRDLAILMDGNAAPSSELGRVQVDLAAIATELGQPTNREKSEARKKIRAATTLEVEHPSGKRSRNIPATKERVRAAHHRVEKRRGQVRRIGPRVNFYEQILAQAIGHIFDDLDSLRRMLRGERIQIERGWTPGVKRIFGRRADFALERTMPRLDVLPFSKTAKLIRYDLTKAKWAKRRQDALAAVDRILASLRLKDAQRAFENLVVMPLAINQCMDIVSEADFRHTRRRLENFIGRFEAEIDDTGFLRPVKSRVLEELRAILEEELGTGVEPDAERLKERLKAVSRLL